MTTEALVESFHRESRLRAASLALTRIEAIDARGAQLVASFLRTHAANRVKAVSASVDVFLPRIGARSLLGTST